MSGRTPHLASPRSRGEEGRGAGERLVVLGEQRQWELTVLGATVEIGGRTVAADLVPLAGELCSLVVDGRSYEVRVTWSGEECEVELVRVPAGQAAGEVAQVAVYPANRRPLTETTPHLASPRRAGGGGGQPGRLVAPMPGRIVAILAPIGAEVAAGDRVLVMEAMKMENELTASVAGRVAELRVAPGDTVEAGALLAVIAAGQADRSQPA